MSSRLARRALGGSARTANFLAIAAALWTTAGSLPAHPAEAPYADGDEAFGAEIPQILSPHDAARYRAVFRLQEQGRWAEADIHMAAIDDPLLSGHVLLQRYLHPTSYRASFEELSAWMELYGDHPEADRIHALALRRKPPQAPEPQTPFSSFESSPPPTVDRRPRLEPLDPVQAALVSKIRSLMADGDLRAAEELLLSAGTRAVLPTTAYDRARAELAMSCFIRGWDSSAYALAAAGADRSSDTVSLGHWIAGLAAYRMGNPYAAVLHFEQHALSPAAGPWNVSAGAYWAARMHLQLRQPKWVDRWLRLAARQSRTFYGIIARHTLGLDSGLDWSEPLLTGADVERVLSLPGGRRAVALAQIGHVVRAESELQTYIWRMDSRHVRSLLAVADALGLPQTSARTAERLMQLGAAGRDRALYPLPPWEPAGGFRVDRALVYAFMRQESLFDATAMSQVGARGLMQLMPRTARAIHDGPDLEGDLEALFDPRLNIALGQQFLATLLGRRDVDGDLFKLAIAYNAGLGNLRRWAREAPYADDPLLFIESLPSRETRIFVERVLANLWIYRQRMGQASPSLDAVVSGDWPKYISMDEPGLMVAEDARH